MQAPQTALLGEGNRLHLNHGPIDLIIGADPVREEGRLHAFSAARDRFGGLLDGLVSELPLLRTPLEPFSEGPAGPVAARMHRAALPHCKGVFVTCMAAVAGAVADEILGAMTESAPLRRAWVNNGGDIAVYLTGGERFDIAMAGLDRRDLGHVRIGHGDGIGGIATSGSGGRSLSLGIADSVTVLAATAASADVAATLIANAVDLPGHPAIRRERADFLQPDSDLGARAVVTSVDDLTLAEIRAALEAGADTAERMQRKGLIAGAALFLRGERMLVGAGTVIEQEKTGRVA